MTKTHRKTDDVINKIINDEISFSEGMKLLDISRKELDELISTRDWLSSLDQLDEISEMEKQSIFQINSIIESPKKPKAKTAKLTTFSIKKYLESNVIHVPCMANANINYDYLVPQKASIFAKGESFGFSRSLKVQGVDVWT
jgi:hypothetical protein